VTEGVARRQYPLAIVAALAALVAGWAGASTAPADARPAKAIWGPLQLADGGSAFPIYRDLGVDVLQVQLIWANVAPRRPRDPRDPLDPAYAWPAPLDAAVADARRSGVRIALLVRGSPAWANGGRNSEWAPRPAHYARFLTAASRRYPSVRRWMIWGEANRAAVFQPLPANRPTGPRAYARLLDAAYGALKRSSRRNLVVGGMTFSFGDVMPARWLRWMRLPSGRRPRLDEYGHNPFSRARPNLRLGLYRAYPEARDIGQLDTFAAELRRAYRGQRPFRRAGPPLWLSEFTVSSDRPNRAFDFAVSRREQAAWLRAGFRIATRVGASGFGWFNLQDEPASVERGLTTGLLTRGGARKPAYRAYKRLR
jgi:hypothetical protein